MSGVLEGRRRTASRLSRRGQCLGKIFPLSKDTFLTTL